MDHTDRIILQMKLRGDTREKIGEVTGLSIPAIDQRTAKEPLKNAIQTERERRETRVNLPPSSRVTAIVERALESIESLLDAAVTDDDVMKLMPRILELTKLIAPDVEHSSADLGIVRLPHSLSMEEFNRLATLGDSPLPDTPLPPPPPTAAIGGSKIPTPTPTSETADAYASEEDIDLGEYGVEAEEQEED